MGFRILLATFFSFSLLVQAAGAQTNTVHILSTGDVGVRTDQPDADLHIFDPNGHAELQFENANIGWKFRVHPTNEQFVIINDRDNRSPFRLGPLANTSLFKIGVDAADRVDITGSLYINNVQVNPDFVFDEGYPLESIEEHAAQMWELGHLPAVGPGLVGKDGKAMIDIASRSQGVLEELEKAHVYIEQLQTRINDEVEAKDRAIGELLAKNEDLAVRIRRLEAAKSEDDQKKTPELSLAPGPEETLASSTSRD